MMQMTSAFFESLISNAINPSSSSVNLTSAVLLLYSAGPTPTPQSKLSDFTELAFSGYARKILTWNTPRAESDGTYTSDSDLSSFLCSATTTAGTALGALLVGTDSITLLGAESFAVPFSFVNPGDGFGYVVSINCGSQSDNTHGTMIS